MSRHDYLMGIDRAIALLDDEPEVASGNVRTFERIFLLILATEYWARALWLWDSLDAESATYVAAATIFCVLAWGQKTRGAGFAALAGVQLLVLRRDFPQAGNHAYLELILCILLATLDPRVETERRLLLRSVRWIACSVLFWSGMQKLVHGYYFRGEQLAHSLQIESFRPVLSLLMPGEDLVRLAAYTGGVGDGPYSVTSQLFIFCANAVYVVEIALAGLLLMPPTRTVAVAGALLFLFAVELAAREVFFGLVFANAILMFRAGGVPARLLGVFAAVLLSLLLVRLGVLPAVVFY